MATLKVKTFPADKDVQVLLGKVEKALTNLTGVDGHKSGVYLPAPGKLDADRDMLRREYQAIWHQCTLEYDPTEPGAEVPAHTRNLKIGPFFLPQAITVMDMEKVILHEYLHLVIDIGWNSLEAQHGQINHIIRDNLHYPGPPNPASPAED
jgi:hypothetical protein